MGPETSVPNKASPVRRRQSDSAPLKTKSDDLFSVFAGFHDQLPESKVYDILDSIISSEIPPPVHLPAIQSLISKSEAIVDRLAFHARDQELDTSMVFPPSLAKRECFMNFRSFCTCLRYVVSGLGGNALTREEIPEGLLTYFYGLFKECAPLPAMPPPVIQAGCKPYRWLRLRSVVCHGLAASEKFVCVVVSEPNCVYTLPPAGRPSRVSLRFAVLPSDSFVLSSGVLTRFSRQYRQEVALPGGDAGTSFEIGSGGETVYVSDGVVLVRISGVRGDCRATAEILDVVTQKPLEERGPLPLVRGAAQLDGNFEDLIPDPSMWHSIPMATNGVLLEMILAVDTGSAVQRVFSLVSGEHLGDRRFPVAGTIRAVAIDAFHRCQWVATTEQGQPGVKIHRLPFPGGADPFLLNLDHHNLTRPKLQSLDEGSLMMASLSVHLRHAVNSHLVPGLFVAESDADLIALIEMARNLAPSNFASIEQATHHNLHRISLQNICCLLSINLVRPQSEAVKGRLFQLLPTLVPKFAFFLVFSHLDLVLKDTDNGALLEHLMASISEKDIHLIAWAREQLAQCLYLRPPDITNISVPIEPRFRHLLVQQQQSLALSVLRRLQQSPFEESGPVKLLIDHFALLINTLPGRIGDPGDSIYFILFRKLLVLLFLLRKSNAIAQNIVVHLDTVLGSLITRLNTVERYRNVVLWSCYVHATFLSTLVRGGFSLSDVETRNAALVRANLDWCETSVPDEVAAFLGDDETPHLRALCDSTGGGWPPDVERRWRLRLLSATVASQLGCLDELLAFRDGATPSDQLVRAAREARRIQNEFTRRENISDDPTDLIVPKCFLLLRLKAPSSRDFPSVRDFIRSVGDFVLDTRFSAEFVIQCLQGQRLKLALTVLAFRLVQKGYEIARAQHVEELAQMLSDALGGIEDFRTLATLFDAFKIDEGQTKCIRDTLLYIARLLGSYNPLVRFAFRFFRSVTGLAGVHQKFVEILFAKETRDLVVSRRSVFALAFSMMRYLGTVPEMLEKNTATDPLRLLLQAEAFFHTRVLSESVEHYVGVMIWPPEPRLGMEQRLVLRVAFNLCDSIDDTDYFRQLFTGLLDSIGIQFANNPDMTTVGADAWEQIHFCRKILLSEKNADTGQKKPAKLCFEDLLREFEAVDSPQRSIALLAIIGASMETVRKYGKVCSLTDRQATYYNISEADAPRFVSSQFDISAKCISVNSVPDAYGVPLMDNTYLDCPGLGHWLMKDFEAYLGDATKGHVFLLFAQAFATLCKSREFVASLTPEICAKITPMATPVHGMWETFQALRRPRTIRDIPSSSGFNVLETSGTNQISYLSPIIAPGNWVTVQVTMDCGGYLGVVSDHLDAFAICYSLVRYPIGERLPIPREPVQFARSTPITLHVNVALRECTIQNTAFDFPAGDRFRVLVVGERSKVGIEILNFVPAAFLADAIPWLGIQHHDYERLYSVPAAFKSIPIPADIAELPRVVKLVDEVPASKKLRLIPPPDGIIFHMDQVDGCSPEYRAEIRRGLFRRLGAQWITVGLLRIARLRAQLVKSSLLDLLSVLVLSLEPFCPEKFALGQFPFRLDASVWSGTYSARPLYMRLDHEFVEILHFLMESATVVSELGERLRDATLSKYRHFGISPNRFSRLFHSELVHVHKVPAIVAGPSHATINGQQQELPLHVCAACDVAFSRDEFVSVVSVSDKTNEWISGTSLELLLVLKSLLFGAAPPAKGTVLKSVFVDFFLADSPLVRRYLPELADLIRVHAPCSPSDALPIYRERLALLGSLLNTRPDDYFKLFYDYEQRVMNSRLAMRTSGFFPEFFSAPIPRPAESLVVIEAVPLDAKDIPTDSDEPLRKFRSFTKYWPTLVGFPYWELLPYFVRLSDVWQVSPEVVGPTATFDSRKNQICVTNPTQHPLTITLQSDPAPDRLRMKMSCKSGPDVEFWFGEDLSIQPGESILSIPHGQPIPSILHKFQVIFEEYPMGKRPFVGRRIDIATIRDAFVYAMSQFAVQWTPTLSETLLSHLTRPLLEGGAFAPVAEHLASCQWAFPKFSLIVVQLKCLLLYHCAKRRKRAPAGDVGPFGSFSTFDDAKEALRAVIVTHRKAAPRVEVNRLAARCLIIESGSDSSSSLICQMSRLFQTPGKVRELHTTALWEVKLQDEMGTGPDVARELLTDCAASIFERTSQLCVPVGNWFVPFSAQPNGHAYTAVGTILGVVLRQQQPQNLPFAPFVWRFLARREFVEFDVLEADAELRAELDGLREGTVGARGWRVKNWDGIEVELSDHDETEVNDVERYTHECIRFRMCQVQPRLEEIYEGLWACLGAKAPPALFGGALMRMAQGDAVTSAALKRFIRFGWGCPDRVKAMLLAAIERLEPDERVMFLKFVTGAPRLPIDGQFQIAVDVLSEANPDARLPGAAVGSNTLKLPKYSSEEVCLERLRQAIHECVTIEML